MTLDRRVVVLVTAAGAIGLSVVLLAASSRHGLAVSPDSVSYLRAADDLTAGRAPTDARGDPFVAWPPLYPALVAATAILTGQSAPAAARTLNGILVVVLVVVFAGAVLRLVAHRSLQLVAVGAVALAPAVLGMAVSALSELLFAVIALAALWAVAESRRSGSWRLLTAAAGLAAAASLTKYVGVVVIGVGTCSLLPRRRVALTFSALASFPLGLWLVHNRLVGGTTTGIREVGPSAGGVLRPVAETAGNWLAPGAPIPALLGVVMAALVGWAVARAVRVDRQTGASPLPFCLFVVGYPLALVVLAAVVGFDPVSHRLLAPAWPPLVLVGAIALDDRLTATSPAGSAPRTGLLVGAAALWMVAAGVVVAHDASRLDAEGGGYGSSRWDDSALLAVTGALPRDATVASNAPYPLAFRTGRTALGADEARPGTLLAWFDDPERSPTTPGPRRAPTSEVAARVGGELRLERVVDDGRLFLVVHRAGPG